MLKVKRKGVSIIEILIAITLLAGITIFFTGSLLNTQKYLIETKKLTVNSFAAVKELEKIRVTTKEQIKTNSISTTLSMPIFSGADQRTIAYYELSVNVKNSKDQITPKGKFITYVGDRSKSTAPPSMGVVVEPPHMTIDWQDW